jgi:AcrR family transcriptional regulator
VPDGFLDLLRGESDALPPGPRTSSDADVAQAHRRRLVAGMAAAAAEKGYAATTIADVVSRAKVSRRTFYEHFADKEACFVAAYEAASEILMGVVEQAAAAEDRWDERIAASMSAYLHVLGTDPDLTRLFLVDILGAGAAALKARRRVHGRFAELVNDLVVAHADESPVPLEWEPVFATAIIGGIDELVRITVQDGHGSEIPALGRSASAFVRAVVVPGTRVAAS